MDGSEWQMQWLEQDGLRLAVFSCGAPDGKPIVFFHGLGHWALGSWGTLAPYLADRYRLIAIDLPGFGVSDKPDVSYDLDYFTATCVRATSELAPRGAMIVGHSLGGLIAASVAAERPTLANRLFLINSTGFKISRPWVVQFFSGKLSASVFSLQPSHWVLRKSLTSSVYNPRAFDAAQLNRVSELLADPLVRRSLSRVYAAAMHELHGRDFVRIGELLRSYRGPVDAVFGSHDPFVPSDSMEQTLAVYPHANVELYEQCGHFAQLEYPERVAHAIREAAERQRGFAAS